jgi:hypothetical protein
MKRIINVCLFISFLFCYLEWGAGNSDFIFQMEYDVFAKSLQGTSVLHPLIILPFLGQLILLFTIFQKIPNKKLTLISICLLGTLVLMILLVGMLALNLRIIGSTIPFIAVAIFWFLNQRRKKVVTVE